MNKVVVVNEQGRKDLESRIRDFDFIMKARGGMGFVF
jgi:hypothetical protein